MSVVPSTVASLFESCEALLSVAEDALDETIGGLPDRVYVSPSEPAFDCCPFLSVFASALGEAPTATGGGSLSPGHRTMSGSIPLVTYQILAVRCAVSIEGSALPSPAAIQASAEEVQQDGWSLWNTIRQAIRDRTIFGECSEVYFDGGIPIAEQGSCVGWRFTIRASLPGIPPSEGS